MLAKINHLLHVKKKLIIIKNKNMIIAVKPW